MRPCPYKVEALLPHTAPMLLLDEILGYDEACLVAGVTIGASSLFLEPDGVPVYVGLEYMAQACGAHVGALGLDCGLPVKIGFLLGTRRYEAHVPWFRRGDRLRISVSMTYRDEQMGAYDGRIEVNRALAAEAQLNVYQPDVAQLVRENRGVTP